MAMMKNRRAKILVMDDDPGILDLTMKMLSRLGHEVFTALSGDTAIEMFGEHRSGGKPFDIAIMDLNISDGMGGRDAIHEILKIDPGAKVIISSGNPIDSVMTNFHEHGFKAAIGKPIALAELNATINFVLDVDKG